MIRLPVKVPGYEVIDSKGASLTTQIVPIPQEVSLIPGRNSKAMFELVFEAKDLPPLGFESFYVMKNESVAKGQMSEVTIISKSKKRQGYLNYLEGQLRIFLSLC